LQQDVQHSEAPIQKAECLHHGAIAPSIEQTGTSQQMYVSLKVFYNVRACDAEDNFFEPFWLFFDCLVATIAGKKIWTNRDKVGVSKLQQVARSPLLMKLLLSLQYRTTGLSSLAQLEYLHLQSGWIRDRATHSTWDGMKRPIAGLIKFAIKSNSNVQLFTQST
jgi:hypothetical protein